MFLASAVLILIYSDVCRSDWYYAIMGLEEPPLYSVSDLKYHPYFVSMEVYFMGKYNTTLVRKECRATRIDPTTFVTSNICFYITGAANETRSVFRHFIKFQEIKVKLIFSPTDHTPLMSIGNISIKPPLPQGNPINREKNFYLDTICTLTILNPNFIPVKYRNPTNLPKVRPPTPEEVESKTARRFHEIIHNSRYNVDLPGYYDGKFAVLRLYIQRQNVCKLFHDQACYETRINDWWSHEYDRKFMCAVTEKATNSLSHLSDIGAGLVRDEREDELVLYGVLSRPMLRKNGRMIENMPTYFLAYRGLDHINNYDIGLEQS